MKLFVASDIHGSFTYAKQMIEAYKKEQCDAILLLGDILYHGPRNDLPEGYNPKEVFALLNQYKDVITCVRGNCDAEVDQMVLEFPILSDYKLVKCNDKTILATHGHVYSKDKTPNEKFDILLSGHTHVPECVKCNGFIACNPGSVSIPKNDSDHGYIVIDETGIYFKTLNGKIYKKLDL